jgi:hypothetical protein
MFSPQHLLERTHKKPASMGGFLLPEHILKMTDRRQAYDADAVFREMLKNPWIREKGFQSSNTLVS